MQKSTTKNFKETQKIGQHFAREILAGGIKKTAVVLCLQGDLGAGKTTFLQGFAKGLGIKETILSPTFVLMKRFAIKKKGFKNFYHFDCYRIESVNHIEDLGLKEIILNPENIVAIEWPERLRNLLPKNSMLIRFKHLEENTREIIKGINPLSLIESEDSSESERLATPRQ